MHRWRCVPPRLERYSNFIKLFSWGKKKVTYTYSKCVQFWWHQYIVVGNLYLFYSLKGSECRMLTEHITDTSFFVSQKHTKEVGRPQTPLKETTLEPWTQPQVGWNNSSDHFFSLVVVSVSIHGNNLQRKVAAGCSVVLLSYQCDRIVEQNDLFWFLAAQTIGGALWVEVWGFFFLSKKCQHCLAFSLSFMCA